MCITYYIHHSRFNLNFKEFFKLRLHINFFFCTNFIFSFIFILFVFYYSFSLEAHTTQVAIGFCVCVRGCVSLFQNLCGYVVYFISFIFDTYTELGVHHCAKDVPNEIFRAT